jgi:DNA-directed RNA polymerase subunit beta
VPASTSIGKVLAHDVVDKETGELLAKANDELTADSIDKLIEAGVKKIETIYVNDLDRGPFISEHAAHRPTTQSKLEALVEIYRMMRPGEPPTKEAAENLFRICSSTRALRSVGRRPDEVQPPRRPRRSPGEGTLSKEDIIDVLRTLIDIRNGNGSVDDIDHLGNRRVAASARWPRTSSASAWCASSARSRSA